MAKKLSIPLLILFSLTALTAFYWWGYKAPSIGIDDANIYFVYMKNFAGGHGFVWHVGSERVEGFTSLLWTLIGSLFVKVSPDHYPMLLLIFGGVLTFFTLYQLLSFSRKINGTEHKLITGTDLIILSLLLLPRGFIEWNVLCLMETSLWSFLLVNMTVQLCRYYLDARKIRIWLISLFIVLINVTRPESLLFNTLFIAIIYFMVYAEEGLKPATRKALIPLLTHIISFGALVVWRISYFGYPFPNTYYAKVSTDRKDNFIGGLKYLFNLFYFYPQTAAITILLAFFAWFLIRRVRFEKKLSNLTQPEKILSILLAIYFCGLVLPLATGGDHFTFSRFYQPLFPIMAVAVTYGYFWKKALGFRFEPGRLAFSALVLSIIVLTLFLSKSTVFDFSKSGSFSFGEFQLAEEGRITAEKFNESFADLPALPSIGTMASGGSGYAYKGKTIDLMGLNDTLMAHANPVKRGVRNHASFDKGAFWKLRPDIMGTGCGGEIVSNASTFVLYENQEYYRKSDFMYACYKQIFDDRDFRSAYIPALVREKKKPYYIFGYYEKDFLQTLGKYNYEVKILERTFDPDKAVSAD
jgi:arabinofuranosyltransferase